MRGEDLRCSRAFLVNAGKPGSEPSRGSFPSLSLRLGKDDYGILVKNRKKEKRNFAEFRTFFWTGEFSRVANLRATLAGRGYFRALNMYFYYGPVSDFVKRRLQKIPQFFTNHL